MKKTTIIILSGFFALQCIANNAELEAMLLDDATIFATIINAHTTPHTNVVVWTEPLFPSTGIITTNSFKFCKAEGNSTALSPLVFEIVSNNVSVAFGYLYECSSFESARNSFMMELVACSRSPESIAQDYEVLPTGVGNFRIAIKPSAYVQTGELHFVRGGKSVSLYPKNGVNIQPIAEMLDELLKHPPTINRFL